MKSDAGVWGEIYAARFLRENGYRLRTANYRTRLGEVDIVAQKDDVLVFVEVKARSENAIAPAMDAVNRAKQRRLSLAAAQYLVQEPPQTIARFDVIEVYLDADMHAVRIAHVPNAFDSIM